MVTDNVDEHLQLNALDLKFVSPLLLTSENLKLAVPGTYEPHKEIIEIHAFRPHIQVLGSKQRPRKICIQGEILIITAISSQALMATTIGFC